MSSGTYNKQLPSKDGSEEGRDRARGLAVVVRQSEMCHQAQDEEHGSDGKAHADDDQVRRSGHGDAVVIIGAHQRAPVPERADVDLLDALDGASPNDPRSDGHST